VVGICLHRMKVLLEGRPSRTQSFRVIGGSERRLHQSADRFVFSLFTCLSKWLLATILRHGTTCEYALDLCRSSLADLVLLNQFNQNSVSYTCKRYSRQASDRGRQAT